MAFPTATAIEPERLNRRAWLALAAAGFGCSSIAATRPLRFAAAWDEDEGSRIGVLEQHGHTLAVRSALEVPSRAHGLLLEPRGRLLAVARRPGDWIVRWQPGAKRADWTWAEPGRAFNGHLVASADGHRLYTVETDLESGQGLVGVRDAASLRKLAEWPTHGTDPHELLLDVDGSLLVANGGVSLEPETGRRKLNLDRMDSSLVRLEPARGELLGQWRLPDTRLSLRHLAQGEAGARHVLGIALQSEHDGPQAKANAPVLALFDGERLAVAAAPQPLAGYGGDIAFAQGLFAVSCPRSHGIALFDSHGRWQRFAALQSACALTFGAGTVWAAGAPGALAVAPLHETGILQTALRLDNHWLLAS